MPRAVHQIISTQDTPGMRRRDLDNACYSILASVAGGQTGNITGGKASSDMLDNVASQVYRASLVSVFPSKPSTGPDLKVFAVWEAGPDSHKQQRLEVASSTFSTSRLPASRMYGNACFAGAI